MAEGGDGANGDAPTTLGSYRVLQPLGSGGMSSVFRAAHGETGLVVALKVLPKTLARRSTLLQRFLREAKSAESLQHPSIVAIYDRGFDEGRHYLVLEYVDGSDLHDRVADRGPLPPAEAVKVVRQAAEGLRYAASRGVIHRDIKPANLLLAKDGTVKVTDLGLAIQAEAEDERVTRDGTTVGTVDYMSPEQARDSRATGVRSDIYSLGCTFYYLLTGTPPYPGGDILDKLRRHAKSPAPDARQARPEIPEAISQLIRRMMAKRPERRFDSYNDLIAALDALDHAGTAPILTALIDDEDDDAIPLTALIDDEDDNPASSSPSTLTALIDDEDDGPPRVTSTGLVILGSSGDKLPSVGPPAPARRTPIPEYTGPPDLAALAAIDAETPSAPTRRPWTRPRSDTPASAKSGPIVAPTSETFDLEEPEPDASSPEIDLPPRGDEGTTWQDVRGWLVGGILALALVGAAAYGIAKFGGGPEGPESPGTTPGAESLAGTPTTPPITTPPTPPTLPTWVEPTEVVHTPSPEPDLAGIVPAWAADNRLPIAPGPVVVVRRVGGVGPGTSVVPSLRQAFDDLDAVVEIADNGPFFEPNLKIPGRSRTVRARPGYRPILVVDPPNNEHLKAQASSILVDGADITLEGIDLVVRVADLTPRQRALFAVCDGSLTLRDCTVTIEAPARSPYAAFLIEEPAKGVGHSTIVLERTLVRGATAATFVLGGDETTLRVDRSVLLSGGGPIVRAGIGEGPSGARARSLELIRSVTASAGPLLDLAPSRAGGETFHLRMIGSTAAMIGGGTAPGLIALRDLQGQKLEAVLTCDGDRSSVAGWPSWLAVGGKPRITAAASASNTWTDLKRIDEAPTSWALDSPTEWFVPADLQGLAEGRAASLERTAAPTPGLFERTNRAFPRQSVPEMVVAGPSIDAGPAVVAIEYDAGATSVEEGGDLGEFLRAHLRPDVRLIRVRAKGSGPRPMTPITLPDGVSLEVVVAPPAAGAEPLEWTPKDGALGAVLLEVRDADLVLDGVALGRRGQGGPETLIGVRNGHLSLNRCRLTARGGTGGSPMITFQAATTGDLPARPDPLLPPADRPVCRIAGSLLGASGDVLSAELGRGVVAATDSAILAEGSAFLLRPAGVRRDRFAADLWIDRCTVVTERSVVGLSRWPGSDPGPGRPWLVSSRASAFFGVTPKPNAPMQGAMLWVGNPDAFARGVIAWQSQGDGFDIPRFAVAGAPPKGQPRADLRKGWTDLWGPAHVVEPIAATASGKPAVVLRGPRPKAIDHLPADLIVDPPSLGTPADRLGLIPRPSGR